MALAFPGSKKIIPWNRFDLLDVYLKGFKNRIVDDQYIIFTSLALGDFDNGSRL
jgi:hypothetical protein